MWGSSRTRSLHRSVAIPARVAAPSEPAVLTGHDRFGPGLSCSSPPVGLGRARRSRTPRPLAPYPSCSRSSAVAGLRPGGPAPRHRSLRAPGSRTDRPDQHSRHLSLSSRAHTRPRSRGQQHARAPPCRDGASIDRPARSLSRSGPRSAEPRPPLENATASSSTSPSTRKGRRPTSSSQQSCLASLTTGPGDGSGDQSAKCAPSSAMSFPAREITTSSTAPPSQSTSTSLTSSSRRRTRRAT